MPTNETITNLAELEAEAAAKAVPILAAAETGAKSAFDIVTAALPSIEAIAEIADPKVAVFAPIANAIISAGEAFAAKKALDPAAWTDEVAEFNADAADIAAAEAENPAPVVAAKP